MIVLHSDVKKPENKGNSGEIECNIQRWKEAPGGLWENAIFLAEFVFVIVLGIYNYNRLRKELPDVL